MRNYNLLFTEHCWGDITNNEDAVGQKTHINIRNANVILAGNPEVKEIILRAKLCVRE
jgi:hypothetical protein